MVVGGGVGRLCVVVDHHDCGSESESLTQVTEM